MNTQHTSGPWWFSKIANNYDQYSIYSEGDPRRDLASSVDGKANALLIAAAPEMIAALTEIEDQLFGHPDRDVGNSKVHYAWHKARNAIAKAIYP